MFVLLAAVDTVCNGMSQQLYYIPSSAEYCEIPTCVYNEE